MIPGSSFPPIIIKEIITAVTNAIADFVRSILPVIANLVANFFAIFPARFAIRCPNGAALTLNSREAPLAICLESLHIFATPFLPLSHLLLSILLDPLPFMHPLITTISFQRSLDPALPPINSRGLSIRPLNGVRHTFCDWSKPLLF
jgi:hypothetical protein